MADKEASLSHDIQEGMEPDEAIEVLNRLLVDLKHWKDARRDVAIKRAMVSLELEQAANNK